MKKYLFILSIIAITSCKTQIIPNTESSSYFVENDIMDNRKVHKNNTVLYFIRHAQVKENTIIDPELSQKGIDKVKKYIAYFKDKRLDSVFSTTFNRTTQTGKLIAKSKGIPYDFYNPNNIDVKECLKRNKGKALLFIGHSNSCPEMVNKVIGKMRFTQLMDDNYSDIYRVIISNTEVYADILTLEDHINSRGVVARRY